MASSIEQRRAAFALQQIQSIGKGAEGKYVSYVSAMPAQIYLNGLGQTLAAMMAAANRQKGDAEKDAHFLICQHLTNWLCELKLLKELGSGKPVQLIDRLMKAEQKTYLLVQVESLAFLEWLKKFARALLYDES